MTIPIMQIEIRSELNSVFTARYNKVANKYPHKKSDMRPGFVTALLGVSKPIG